MLLAARRGSTDSPHLIHTLHSTLVRGWALGHCVCVCGCVCVCVWGGVWGGRVCVCVCVGEGEHMNMYVIMCGLQGTTRKGGDNLLGCNG